MSAGDNFYDYGVTSISDSLFQRSFDSVYDAPVLRQLPWYVVLGNHDYRGNVDAQIFYSRISTRWNMPARYFSIWLAPHSLMAIFLDTTPFSASKEGKIAAHKPQVDTHRQLTWLNNTLRSAPPSCRFFVTGHHNMYSASVADHRGDTGVAAAFEPILLPFAKRVVAYTAGHEHALMHMKPYENEQHFHHFVSGAGSKLRAIVTPRPERAVHWRECCNVLATTSASNQSSGIQTQQPQQPQQHTIWSNSTNGFFLFNVNQQRFTATAYDKDAKVIHRYLYGF